MQQDLQREVLIIQIEREKADLQRQGLPGPLLEGGRAGTRVTLEHRCSLELLA
jgi:hypothetical protein